MHESTGSESVGEVVEEPVRSAADLGRAIRARRRGQGLNQDRLALLADSNRVAEIERGGETERLQLLWRLLNELGLELIVRPRNVRRGPRV